MFNSRLVTSAIRLSGNHAYLTRSVDTFKFFILFRLLQPAYLLMYNEILLWLLKSRVAFQTVLY